MKQFISEMRRKKFLFYPALLGCFTLLAAIAHRLMLPESGVQTPLHTSLTGIVLLPYALLVVNIVAYAFLASFLLITRKWRTALMVFVLEIFLCIICLLAILIDHSVVYMT